MGDLRNKMAKIEAAERHRRFMAEHHPPRPPVPLPRCKCGHTHLDVPPGRFWEKAGETWPRAVQVFCHLCLPPDELADMLAWQARMGIG